MRRYVALIASRHRSKLVLDYLVSEGVPTERSRVSVHRQVSTWALATPGRDRAQHHESDGGVAARWTRYTSQPQRIRFGNAGRPSRQGHPVCAKPGHPDDSKTLFRIRLTTQLRRFFFSDTISAMMLRAISSGVFAPISSPAGACTVLNFSRASPLLQGHEELLALSFCSRPGLSKRHPPAVLVRRPPRRTCRGSPRLRIGDCRAANVKSPAC